MKKSKYTSWGSFLKTKRKQRFRSAREFCAKISVGISYPQYSRYEAGEQLPSLDQALKLCRLLDIPLQEGLLEWSLSQVQDLTLQAELQQGLNGGFSGFRKQPSASPVAKTVYLDDAIVFNRSHMRLFNTDPAYRDIFTYVNSFRLEWVALTEIAEALRLDLKRLRAMAHELQDLGVLDLQGDYCRTSKCVYYFPDDQEFFDVRNKNLSHNVQSVIQKLSFEDLNQRRAFRGLVTRELTLEQVDALVTQMDGLLSGMVHLHETPEAEKVYSLCLLFGERFRLAKKTKAKSQPMAQSNLG